MAKDPENDATDLRYPAQLVSSATPPASVRLTENVFVKMRDGIRLAVDIYSPMIEGRYPVLLSMSPYSKDIQQKPPHWSHAIESGATGFFVDHGYIHVIAQSRGAGLSQGKWELFGERERSDGYDLIEWIAAQQWCDGNVGMIGDSYWSWSQYHAAAAQPPHLKCICLSDGTTDLYRDLAYQGGIYNAEFLDTWISYHTRMFAWPGPVEGKLPPMNLTYELANRPCDGPWYHERSAKTYLAQIKVPVMSISPQGGAMHARGQLAGYRLITAPKKLLIVPPTGFWSHVQFLTNYPLNKQMLRWFDHWMKGIDTGIMNEPEVAIFDAGTRKWRYEREYPVARTRWTKFYLRGRQAESEDAGSLQIEPAGNEDPDSYRLPDSIAQLLASKPALSYRTAPLKSPLRIWGPLNVCLHASSTQKDTVWFVKLAIVSPDGQLRPISRGMLRASFRALDKAMSLPGQPYHPFDKQELLEPGRVYEYEIEMRPVFITLAAGHRLELQIASEDLSYSNKQRTLDVQLLPWPVENTVFHDKVRPSHLLLPIVPDAPDDHPVGSPVAEIEWPLMPTFWRADIDGWPLREKPSS